MKNRIKKILMGLVPLFLVAAVLNFIAVDSTDAQNVGVAQSRVAVIDIKYILENHVAFKQAME